MMGCFRRELVSVVLQNIQWWEEWDISYCKNIQFGEWIRRLYTHLSGWFSQVTYWNTYPLINSSRCTFTIPGFSPALTSICVTRSAYFSSSAFNQFSRSLNTTGSIQTWIFSPRSAIRLMTTECAEALSLMTRDTCAGVVVADIRAAIISGAALFSRVYNAPRWCNNGTCWTSRRNKGGKRRRKIPALNGTIAGAGNMPYSRGERPARCWASQCSPRLNWRSRHCWK